MQGLSSGAAVLRIWENAVAATWDRRGSVIVASSSAEPLSAVEALPVGRRDRQLLELRRSLMGEAVEARQTCPACGATVEARFGIGDILVTDAGDAATREVCVGDTTLTVRAPTAGELAALMRSYAEGGDLESARVALRDLCVIACRDADGATTALPDTADAMIAEAVEALDPLAAIAFSLTCPDCEAGFETAFDPTDFVWREVSATANRLLWEVDQLARAYGWPEADILALSPTRRRAYLEIAAG